jgi:hypothetical protein
VVLSIAAIAALQLAAEQWPGIRTVFRLLPPLLALGLLSLLYRNWIARDRVAFVSVAAPALVLTTASVFARWPWSGAFFWAALGLILGVAWWTPMRGWRTVHVLRRPPLTPRRLFRGGLRSDLYQWSSAMRGDGPLSPGQRRRAEAAIASMRGRKAPDDQLGAIRDDLVDVADRWTATPRDEDHTQAYVDLRDDLTRVREQLLASVEDD